MSKIRLFQWPDLPHCAYALMIKSLQKTCCTTSLRDLLLIQCRELNCLAAAEKKRLLLPSRSLSCFVANCKRCVMKEAETARTGSPLLRSDKLNSALENWILLACFLEFLCGVRKVIQPQLFSSKHLSECLICDAVSFVVTVNTHKCNWKLWFGKINCMEY